MAQSTGAVIGDAYFVCVMPERFTFCICVMTSLTGSTGGLHEIKMTGCTKISLVYATEILHTPHGVFVWELATEQIGRYDKGEQNKRGTKPLVFSRTLYDSKLFGNLVLQAVFCFLRIVIFLFILGWFGPKFRCKLGINSIEQTSSKLTWCTDRLK